MGKINEICTCLKSPFGGFRGLLFFLIFFAACQQKTVEKALPKLWHNQARTLRYYPDGHDFVIKNGTHRFNRALYGSHTGFRDEAGDLPEFALYMPRMGGTLRLGLIQGDSSKWLTDAQDIEARYRAGKMIYNISDPMLGGGHLHLELLALPDADGMILKVESEYVSDNVNLFWGFGGASGKRFSRDGDLGADPESSFDLKPEYCKSDEYFLKDNSFDLYYGSGRPLSDNEVYENNYQPTKEELAATRLKSKKRIFGLVPGGSEMHVGDASSQKNPLQFLKSEKENAPVVVGTLNLRSGKGKYFLLVNPDTKKRPMIAELPALFNQADSAREQLANRIKIDTPDDYINAVGASLSTAADAVWDGHSFMHGAIAWRMPLDGWRGAYAADWLGWHDRAETHFSGYFAAQYTEPASGPSVPDPKTHLSRQKEEVGTALFTNGYISRNPGKISKPHHYDMNQVFIDQLLWHFRWTGNLEFLRKSWPVLQRHLAWEKRNFDANNDGLYDSYASIWASDALQYSGGGVTHSSAYNYQTNKMAAELAPLIGKDPTPYEAEAKKIKQAVNEQLWLPAKGWFAEYKDLLGNQLVHPSAALWTVYHAIDEGMADPFQAWQTTEYVDHSIPHIPVEAKGLPVGKYHTLSTTNWMPYTWSINNVALAEVLHTALAYWQTGRGNEAFTLAKSSFLDYMYMGTSPANFGQLSFYDAFRGELYRDFADPIGVASRAMIEGLFGVSPDLIHQTLTIKPGWPKEWDYARLETPDLKLHFQKIGCRDQYTIESKFPQPLRLRLVLKAASDQVKSVKLNGQEIGWDLVESAIGTPELAIESDPGSSFKIEVKWAGKSLDKPAIQSFYAEGDSLSFHLKEAEVLKIYDPQEIFESLQNNLNVFRAKLNGEPGWRTAFVQLQQGEMTWWQPLSFELREPIKVICPKDQPQDKLVFSIQNNLEKPFNGQVIVGNFKQNLSVPARTVSSQFSIPAEDLIPGSNTIRIETEGSNYSGKAINWNIHSKANTEFEPVDLSHKFNDRVTNIFKEQYYSPRSPYPTLSIPVQGIGDWCSYKETEDIDDSGLRKLAGEKKMIESPEGIPFSTPNAEVPNILFTSQWDNYPDSVQVPLSGKASHLYLLMAGSVHHMQINMMNGEVHVKYNDGTEDVLPLVSPDNWWPIEQDYYQDGFAFQVHAPQPPRLYLKTGEWHLDSYSVLAKNKTIKIGGGAASLLDLPLDPTKELKSLTLETNTNDVVIGLMAATLKR